jgi:hypothetical protein
VESILAGAELRTAQLRISRLGSNLRAPRGTMLSARRATCGISSATDAVLTKGEPGFYQEQGLDPLPVSTGIRTILCRPELLIEIEAIAMFRIPPETD